MPHSWEEIKAVVERNEDAQLRQQLAKAEVNDGQIAPFQYPVQRSRLIVQLVGAAVAGLHVAVMTLIFNYLLFVWILHVSFDN
jgi:hypothetical protein